MVALFFAVRLVQGYDDSGKEGCDLCRNVVREHHRFRHWKWSGIFPFEGGFIPDPHYLWSETAKLSRPVEEELGLSCRYQVVDVNPFFNDRTSEILLLIGCGGTVYQYSLDYPKGRYVQAVLGTPTPPSAMIFKSEGKLLLLTDFLGPAKGIYLLPLPLRSNTNLELIPVKNSQFTTIAAGLKSIGNESTTKEQFCGSTNGFVAFYRKFVGPCDQTDDPAAVERDFAKFWYDSN